MSVRLRSIAAWFVAAGAAAAPGITIAAGEARWVDATRLALRAQPSTQAAVLGYLVTNTPVAVEARNGEWCELTSEGRHGFVVCRYLAAQPLSARQLDDELRGAGGRASPEALQKRFWIEPSVARLMAYGQALDAQVFGAEPEVADSRAPRPRRAEFEAMKRRLRDGWSPPPTLPSAELAPAGAASLAVLPRVGPSLLRRSGMPTLSDVSAEEGEAGRQLLRATSFDGVSGDVGGALATLVASATGGAATLRAASFGPPQALHYGGYFGAWDIGGAEVSLAAGGLSVMVVDAAGGARSARITGLDTRNSSPGVGCEFVGHFVLDRPVGDGFIALLQPERHGVKSVRRLLSHELPADAPWARALLQQVEELGEKAQIAAGKPGRLATFDLDEDGVADLAQLSIEVKGDVLMSGTAYTSFFNLGGRWHVAGRFLPQSCGC